MTNREVLKAKNLKYTVHRDQVLRIFNQEVKPISVEQIHALIDGQVDLSTIYRTVNTFVDAKIIIKVSISESEKTYYMLNSHKHIHHLICLECKKVEVIEGCPIHHYEDKLKATSDYEIVSHNLEIYGYCPECKNKKKV